MQNMSKVVSSRFLAKCSLPSCFNAARLCHDIKMDRENPEVPEELEVRRGYRLTKPKRYPPGDRAKFGSVSERKAWEMLEAEAGRQSAIEAAKVSVDEAEVRYPPVKPKYPPGLWGSVAPKNAWKLYKTRENLLSKETAKLRLEEMAGPYDGKQLIMWIAKSVDNQPGLLPYKKHVTKTHIERKLPDTYSDDAVTQVIMERLKPIIKDALLMHNEYYQNYDAGLRTAWKIERKAFQIQYLLGNILDALIGNLCFEAPHLQDAQVILLSILKVFDVWRCEIKSMK